MRRNRRKCIVRAFAFLMIVLFAAVVLAELLIGSGVRNFSQTGQALLPLKPAVLPDNLATEDPPCFQQRR